MAIRTISDLKQLFKAPNALSCIESDTVCATTTVFATLLSQQEQVPWLNLQTFYGLKP